MIARSLNGTFTFFDRAPLLSTIHAPSGFNFIYMPIQRRIVKISRLIPREKENRRWKIEKKYLFRLIRFIQV